MAQTTPHRIIDSQFSGPSFDWEPLHGSRVDGSGISAVELPGGASEFSHVGIRHCIDLHGDMSPGRMSLDNSKPIRHVLEKNSVGFIPAGCEFRSDMVNLRSSFLIFVDPALLEEIGAEHKSQRRGTPAPLFWRHDPTIAELGHRKIARTLSLLAEEDDDCKRLAIETWSLAICARFLEIDVDRGARPTTASRHNDRIFRAIDYIETNLAASLRLSDIAAAASMAPYHFLRAFKDTTGTTPHQLVLRRRIETACSLLETTQAPVSEIALRSGFASQSHLTTTMRRSIGQTPWRYRELL